MPQPPAALIALIRFWRDLAYEMTVIIAGAPFALLGVFAPRDREDEA